MGDQTVANDRQNPARRGSRSKAGRAPTGIAERGIIRALLRRDTSGPAVAETLEEVPVGRPDDREERDADAVAHRVLAGLPVASSAPASPSSGGQVPWLGPGAPLPKVLRGALEPRFGRSLDHVRLHHGAQAENAADALGARAFAYGSDIGFARGEYAPHTERGQHLLTHEIAHTLQPSPGVRRIRRVTHGPSTPTNCHNWTIPLPPWTAGTLAHNQAAYYFAMNPGAAGRILSGVTMPRGTKALMGYPNPPGLMDFIDMPGFMDLITGVPPGFMDLIGVASELVQIAEIKSTAAASQAKPQAAHYLMRHNEWLTRSPHTGLDAVYSAVVGGGLPEGELMSGLASVTGTGIDVGLFWGDPGKTLWLEADTAGAIVYWCEGVGVTNPLWALAFRSAFDSIKSAFWDAYRKLLETVAWAVENPVLAFATGHLIALCVVLCFVIIGLIIMLIGLLAEALAAAIASAATALAGAAAVLAAVIVLLGLLGVGTSEFESSAQDLLALLGPTDGEQVSGSDYERDADSGGWSSATASAGAGGSQLEAAVDRLASASTGVLGQLSSRALDAINPLSSTAGLPSLETARSSVLQAAQLLASNSDPQLAALGTDAIARLELL